MYLEKTFVVLGCLGMAGAVILFIKKRAFYAKWTWTSGVVTELISSRSDSDGHHTVWAPRVRFQMANGQVMEFLSKQKSRPPIAKVGEPVTVIYDPANTDTAEIYSFLWLHIAEVLFFLAGATSAGLATYTLAMVAR